MENQDLHQFLEERKIRFYPNADIKPYVTMGIGGTVQLIVVVSTEQHLKEVLSHLRQHRYRYVFLGGGSNVIFHDGFSDLIVVINRTPGIFKGEDSLIKVNSGVLIRHLMEWNILNNIGGMEFLAGIPGTVGGAAAVNAGAFGQSISAILEKAEIMTQTDEIKTVPQSDFDFSYRHSRFKHSDEVILNVYLRYTPLPGDQVKEKVNANLNYRKEHHPNSSQRSAGCFFKNPVLNGKKMSAGQLLEQAGFKGSIYETLDISPAHANFIINSHNASFKDVCQLESDILKKIFRDKGIKLEREVIYISPDGKKY